MTARTPFLVSGISSLTDARYAAGMNVPYCSLVWSSKGETTLDPSTFTAIRAWIEGVEWWGEYKGNDPVKLLELADSYQLKTWILNPEFPDLDTSSGLEFLIPGRAASGTSVVWLPSSAAAVREEVFREAIAGGAAQVLVLNPESVDEIEMLSGLSEKALFRLQSGEEDRPGWMDLTPLQDILERWDEA
jgi:hypothetical protein